MDAGECSTSASSPSASTVWAKLVPADSASGEEIAWCDAVVCSLVAPAGGEELAWCEIRRGGDASSATIRNLRFWGNRKINQGNTLCHIRVMKSTILICHVLSVATNLVDLDAVHELRTCNATDVEG